LTVADTVALVALLDQNHPRHAKASAALAEGHITITWGTLAEVATVTRRLAKDSGLDGNRAAREAIAAIRGLAGFREAATLSLEAVANMHRTEPSLSFVDAWNLCAAILNNDGLLSFDRSLRSAARRHRSPLTA
jgi:predicted nucleic acid-binding protein